MDGDTIGGFTPERFEELKRRGKESEAARRNAMTPEERQTEAEYEEYLASPVQMTNGELTMEREATDHVLNEERVKTLATRAQQGGTDRKLTEARKRIQVLERERDELTRQLATATRERDEVTHQLATATRERDAARAAYLDLLDRNGNG